MDEKCKWCGDIMPTPNEVKECQQCWELRTRIEKTPDVAKKMLDDMKSDGEKMADKYVAAAHKHL